MKHRFSRSEFYDLIWSEPMTKVAARFGISGVGLAKACRRHDIPVPPRGFWAKLQHGQSPRKEPLPPRGPGMAETIEFEVRERLADPPQGASGAATADGGPRATPAMEPPEPRARDLPQDLVELDLRMRRVLGTVAVARDLTYPHKAIAKLLSKDDDLRRKAKESPYLASYYAPKFDSPLQQRRLRIASSIFVALDRCRCKSSVWYDERQQRYRFHVGVGDSHASFSLEPAPAERGKASTALGLEIEIKTDLELQTRWHDEPGRPIEKSLTDVAVTILLVGELQHRQRAEARKRFEQEEAERKERARVAAEKAARVTAEERVRKAERERVRTLLRDVASWKRAVAIREFVAALQEACDSGDRGSPLTGANKENAALQYANKIDPVLRRREESANCPFRCGAPRLGSTVPLAGDGSGSKLPQKIPVPSEK